MMMSMGNNDAYKHVEHCCHHKQACYQICGSNKQLCDKELEKCMDEGCTELSGLTTEEASSMSEDDKQKQTEPPFETDPTKVGGVFSEVEYFLRWSNF